MLAFTLMLLLKVYTLAYCVAFTQPNGIAASPDGKVVYVSQINGKLRKITF